MLQDTQGGGSSESALGGRFPKLNKMYVRMLLRGSFVSPKEVATKRPDLIYNSEQIDLLVRTLPNTEVLNALSQGGYVLMPQPPEPLSLVDIRQARPEHFLAKENVWYEQSERTQFARTDVTGAGWLAVKRFALHGSVGQTFIAQHALLGPDERVPNVAEMAWFASIFCDVRRVRLFSGVRLRTSSRDVLDRPVEIGQFEPDGMLVSTMQEHYRCGLRGLAVAYKL